MNTLLKRSSFGLLSALILVITAAVVPSVFATGEVADEIHYSYGESADQVVVRWRGDAALIEYGLTMSYGQQATAGNATVTPVDIAGPFREVKLSGLQPGTAYHYRIGGGSDNVLKTRPTGNFTWVDTGDTGTTLCSPWLADTHSLIAAQQPDFVTHGGDISYANECGTAAVHRYYTDQEVWSHSAAFQPVLGNHEYGTATPEAPVGTPRDSLLNYKGRSYFTNAQTVSADTATKTSNPGCGWETGSTVNTCRGEDWGWFKVGGVLYISYPEPWINALTDWEAKAKPLMAQAQADPLIDFIVTYGHRPAYSGQATNASLEAVRTATNNLAQLYSPRTDNPNGKYVLNVAHHVHGEEVYRPINGLVHITNGGGGEGQTTFSTVPNPDSIYRTVHPAIMAGVYGATDHTLKISMLCGPHFTPNPKELCTYGSTLYSQTFTRGSGPTPVPAKQWVGNQGVETDLTGWTGKYGASPYVSVTRSATDGSHSGVAAIKVLGLAGANNLASGFNDNPRWVLSAVAGKTYTASAWVKPQSTGQVLNLRVREWQGTTLISDARVPLTPQNTDWQQVTAQVTAANSGSQLSFAVYANDIDAGKYFLVDDLSLTSPN